jgi:hypothetical protein
MGGLVQEQVPQVHVGEHFWLPYMLQVCVVDGAQTPGFMHCWATHWPVGPHVSVSVPQKPQGTGFVSLGPQTPVQTPLTHVWCVHATAVPHCPLALQVSTPSPEHCTAPGTQTPPQAPPVHTNWHGWGLPKWPVESQVSTPLFEHWVAPGVHVPVQLPAVQTLGHGAPLFPHVPEGEHFCGCCPLHCLSPGTQVPVHDPATHA